MGKTFLGVGHCGLDSRRLAEVIERLGGDFCNVATCEDALTRLHQEPCALVLPNRVIGQDEEGGLKVVRAVRADKDLSEVPVMLVSAIAEAQQAAVAAGAVPGIGKNALESEEVLARLKHYL